MISALVAAGGGTPKVTLPRSLARFCLVGVSVACAQLAFLMVLMAWLGPYLANGVAVGASMRVRFALSSLFTWSDRRASGGSLLSRGRAFHGAVVGTAAVNLMVFALARPLMPTLMAAGAGIGVSACLNYIIGDRMVFRAPGIGAALPRSVIAPLREVRRYVVRHWDLLAVASGTALASGLAYAHYQSAGFILLYGDAVSRLNIARRVVDSLDPGLVQLGNIWPPLPQILMLPLVWIDPLWQSGLAGSIPSMAAFVAASLYLYALGYRLTGRRLGGLVASLVLVSNPNMLYLQAVPLSESLMLAIVAATAYHMMRWIQEENASHLMAAAAWVFAGSLTRYEGWALVAGGALIVVAFSLARYRDWRRAEALMLTFLMPAAFGIFLWMFYSTVIFGNPLNFATGFGTTRFDTDIAAARGLLATKWDLWNTLLTFVWSAVDMIGLPLLGAATVGLAVVVVSMALSRQPDRWSGPATILMLAAPALLVVVTLFAGTTIILGPHTTVEGLWNTRYGLQALPAVALLVAYPARIHRYVGVLLVVVLLAFSAFTYGRGDSLTLEFAASDEVNTVAWAEVNFPVLSGRQPLAIAEGLSGVPNMNMTREAAIWLSEHHLGERVLLSAFANSPFMFYAGLPLRTFVFEGAQPYWDDELAEPGSWTGWVVMVKGASKDLVALKLGDQIENSPRFELAFENDLHKIYKVVSPVARAEEVKR